VEDIIKDATYIIMITSATMMIMWLVTALIYFVEYIPKAIKKVQHNRDIKEFIKRIEKSKELNKKVS